MRVLRAVVYERVSHEESAKFGFSIKDQRDRLARYIEENNMVFVEEYVDDGYSGTNFDRPAFQQMLEDIKAKKINCVVVKDLSRFGRDHVMTGYYIETFFPENKIIYIYLHFYYFFTYFLTL